jgi:NitT/TauT family transport system ATP-binding protein
VTHIYGGTDGTPAVEGLTLTVERGEFAAVVGPSGCGKSTLMKLATGLQFPIKGSVRVAGEVVHQPLKIAGMAFQAPTLLPWRTTLDNLLLPLEIVEPHRSRIGRHKAEYVARAKNLLTSVGLGGQGDKFPWELSGGMQQRTSLCRALIHEPELLMLDEPFGALDAFTREELWCVIRDLQQARGITVILVTHDLREAVFLADRVFVMSARPGRILVERRIDIPRPRDLEVAFTPAFQDIVHELRGHIVRARQ